MAIVFSNTLSVILFVIFIILAILFVVLALKCIQLSATYIGTLEKIIVKLLEGECEEIEKEDLIWIWTKKKN